MFIECNCIDIFVQSYISHVGYLFVLSVCHFVMLITTHFCQLCLPYIILHGIALLLYKCTLQLSRGVVINYLLHLRMSDQ